MLFYDMRGSGLAHHRIATPMHPLMAILSRRWWWLRPADVNATTAKPPRTVASDETATDSRSGNSYRLLLSLLW